MSGRCRAGTEYFRGAKASSMKLPWILCITASLTVSTPTYTAAKPDCALMQQLAQEHANDMARREKKDHSGFHNRAARGARAENVAMGSKTEAEAMAQWRNSTGHAANMRLAGCKAIAHAVSRSGRYYWVMEIGKSPAELASQSTSKGTTRSGEGGKW